ncbi:DNA repair protein RecN, partial [bacterium]|nr:DNA repair protein RecN [bacterium]
EEALPLLEETGYFLRDYKDRTESDPERLAIVQERLQQISGLKRKYGPEIEDIITHYDSAKLELEELEHYEERQISLQAELNRTSAELTRQALGLSKKRQTAAKKIEPGVVKQLSEMAMPDARFSIKFSREAGNDTDDGFRASHTGIDHVSFLISPNPGEQLAPLAKTASGGELSRIMLALKVVLAKDDKIPCLVFDEVDAGIGGKTAETVGMKLKGLSISNQVICITHLPQIASFADTHMKIEKTVIKDRTSVRLSQIDSASRSKEIARMLSGSISETSVRHAEEMLKKYAGTVD